MFNSDGFLSIFHMQYVSEAGNLVFCVIYVFLVMICYQAPLLPNSTELTEKCGSEFLRYESKLVLRYFMKTNEYACKNCQNKPANNPGLSLRCAN